MRFSVKFKIINKNSTIPIHYQNMVISILKGILKEADEELFNEFYEDRNGYKPNVLKPFTFSTYVPNADFLSKEIVVRDRFITVNFSMLDYKLAINLFNGFLGNSGKEVKYKEYILRIEKLNLIQEETIISNEVIFKTMSPILVRLHNRSTNRDEYLTSDDTRFKEEFEKLLMDRIEKITGKRSNIFLEEYDLKKKIIKYLVNKEVEIYISGNVGNLKLRGDNETLDLIYKSGILSSRNSEGFGMVKTI